MNPSQYLAQCIKSNDEAGHIAGQQMYSAYKWLLNAPELDANPAHPEVMKFLDQLRIDLMELQAHKPKEVS